ncbi:unnamed protein product [Closterium sp. NIES-54]
MVISRCCSPVVQIALKPCRQRLDAGHQAWRFILSTYQARDNQYIGQLEEQMTHLRMGEQESATDYCNRAQRILAEMRMAGVGYSMVSNITHVVKGLSSGNKPHAPDVSDVRHAGVLDEDTLTSHIIKDEVMLEAERPTELLPHTNYVAPTKQSRQQGQCEKPSGGGSGGGRSTKDADEKKSARDKGLEVVVDGTSAGSAAILTTSPSNVLIATTAMRMTTREAAEGPRRRRGVVLDGRRGRADSLAAASKDFKAVATAVQANPTVVLLDNGYSHHLMRTKEVYVDMAPSGDVKHVRGFNGALLNVKGRSTVALQGEDGKQVLIPDVLYVPGVQANLLSAGQLQESGMRLQDDGDAMLLVSSAGEVLGRARYTSRVFCNNLRPCSTKPLSKSTEVVALRTIASAKKSIPDWWHARLAHVSIDTIRSSAKHEFAIGLDIKPSADTDSPCVSCFDRKLARPGSSPRWRQTHTPEVKYGPASGQTRTHMPTDTSTTTFPLLAEVDEPADEDIEEVPPSSPVLAPPTPVADLPASTLLSATGNMGSLEKLPMVPASDITGGRCNVKIVSEGVQSSTTWEQQIGEPVEKEVAAEVSLTGEQQVDGAVDRGAINAREFGKRADERGAAGRRSDDEGIDDKGELSAGEKSTDNDVVEVRVEKPKPRRSGRTRRPPEQLSFHACLPPAAFTMLLDDADADVDLPELDPDMHADPEHRWDIATVTVKEALASWKGKAVKAAMNEEICSLVANGTKELVERPRGVNIINNWWVLMTKYHIENTVEREKVRLVREGGFTHVYGADSDETYSPFSSYVTLRVFHSIVAILDLNLMQLDKNIAFLHSKLYRALDAVLLGSDWKKSQVDEALYFQGGQIPKAPIFDGAYIELTFNDEEAQEREEEEYWQKVGLLQFAATTTRPNIAFSCSKLGSGLTGRAVDFEDRVDDLQLFLHCDRADGLSLFDLTSGASPAPPAYADSAVRSQWATRDAAARLVVRHHLLTTERAHFSQYKSAKTLYDAVVACYSSPATADLSRLMLPYLFPDIAAFPTIDDLITHLCTSDTRYRAALPAEFCAKNPPPPSGDAAPAGARGARALEGLAGAVEVEVEEAEGVGVVVGVVAGVGASVAVVAAEVAAAVAVGAEEEAVAVAAVAEMAAEEVELVGVALRSGAA